MMWTWDTMSSKCWLNNQFATLGVEKNLPGIGTNMKKCLKALPTHVVPANSFHEDGKRKDSWQFATQELVLLISSSSSKSHSMLRYQYSYPSSKIIQIYLLRRCLDPLKARFFLANFLGLHLRGWAPLILMILGPGFPATFLV